MSDLHQKVQALLNRHQLILLWVGILIVFLLIVTVMLSWVTMLKVSLLQENVDTMGAGNTVSSAETHQTVKEAVIAELATQRIPLNDEEKQDIIANRLNTTERVALTPEEKALVVGILNGQ